MSQLPHVSSDAENRVEVTLEVRDTASKLEYKLLPIMQRDSYIEWVPLYGGEGHGDKVQRYRLIDIVHDHEP